MKKYLIIGAVSILVLVVIVVLFFKENNSIDLKKYVTLYNKHHYTISMNEGDGGVKATAKDNKIIIEPWGDEIYTFELKDNILSATFPYEELPSAIILLDCIGQTQGFKEDEVYSALLDTIHPSDEEYGKYSLKNNGVEMKIDMEASDNWKSTVSIDLSRKISL